MNNALQPPAQNAIQKERLLFRELSERLINALLNRLFDLNPRSAARRMSYLTAIFLLAGILITLSYYPLNLWIDRVREILWYLLNSTYAASYVGDPFTKFIDLAVKAITDAHVLQYFPIFLAPFFIALHLAALYLADIFELEDVAVARSFVWEVALSGSDETLHITQGKIAEQHLESPNYLIGGPGKVIVDLDSVALFERADGTPHVIGPTGKEPYGKATIDGFERFRQAIDIRDQHVDITVSSRSRDGIPITATDVRLMFSIYHGENTKPSPEYPYPFSKEAVERIVYKSTSKVMLDQANPSAYEFSWINNMIGLIRGRLSGFMSERNVSEYLASIGTPEFEKLKRHEELIAEQIRRLTKPTDESSKTKTIKPPPDFTPRYKITNLFSQFTDEFTKSARNNGVELHWIGVGTWKTPLDTDIITEKHLEAWQLSQENLKNGSPESMKKAESEAILGKMATLIQNVPIEAYHDLVGIKKQFNRKLQTKKQEYKPKDSDFLDEEILFYEDELQELLSENLKISDLTKHLNDRITAAAEKKYKDSDRVSDHRDSMRALLLEYRKELLEAIQFIKAKGEFVPPVVEEAIRYINNQMGFKHWAGTSSPEQISPSFPTPVTLLDNTYAQTRIQDLPADNKLRVGGTYHLHVDIVQDLQSSSMPINLLTNKQETIDIVVQAEDMIIQPNWFHNILITPTGKSMPPEFILIPQKSGNKTVIVQYYLKSHWLTQIKYQFEVLDEQRVPSDTNTNKSSERK